ncbi:MAG TPA: caspase family protein, partial [Hyphomicrobiaceae bacterium]|nr:caspase family protein [Hyphomicrobiaceae bacterium]
IVGINTYTGNDARGRIKSLRGCLNDADDIERQVRRWQPAGLRRLGWDAAARIEKPVTRADIFGAWRETLAAAAPGDTVLFTYSGHGSQVEVAPGNPTNEADGYDETLVLTGYSTSDGRDGEHILDDEIDQMLAAAQANGILVVFISDSCHSGTVFRSLDMSDTSYRFIQPAPLSRAVGRAGPAATGERPRVLPNVLFLAGSQENEAVPEIVYEGQYRGALSVGVARCLEAQAASSGIITAYDFAKQVLSKARAVADNGHHPDVRWPAAAPPASPAGIRKAATMVTERGSRITRDTPIFTLRSTHPATTSVSTAAADPTPVTLRIVGLGEADQRRIVAGLDAARLAGEGDAAALVWDAERQLILNDQRQRIAENVGAGGLQHAVDRRLALDRLIRMENGLELKILLSGRETPASDATHPPGTQFDIAIAGIPDQHYYCLFNLTGDGQVQLLEPSPRRAGERRGGMRKHERTEADITVKGIVVTREGPFGAEHVVAVSSELPLNGLVATLTATHNRYAVPTVMAALETTFAMQKPLGVGFRGIYSRRA